MITSEDHYLKSELYQLVRADPQLFDFLQAGSLDGIWYWDLENPENEWMSPQFWSTLGYDPCERKHLASEWQDLIYPEDLQNALDMFHKHIENPEMPYDLVVRYHHKKGHTVWIRCRGIAIRNRDGVPVRMLGAHNDVTALKRAESKQNDSVRMLEQLRRAQSLFMNKKQIKDSFDLMLKTLLEGTHSEYGFIGEVLIQSLERRPYLKTHAITNIAWDEKTRLFYAQNAPVGLEFYNLESLFGSVIVSEKPVISNQPSEDKRACGLPPGHPPLNSFLGLPFFHGHELIGMVGIANRPGGYDQEVIHFLAPFLSTCSNLIMGYRNEMQRKEAEQARQKAQAELIQAKESAEKANLTKSRFLATMSHEIRTPLNGILGMAQLLLMPNLNENERIDAAQTIMNSGQTLLALLNDILDLAKIEEGKVEIKKQMIQPRLLIRETIDLFTEICKRKGLAITSEIDANVKATYISDPIRLRQMLSNFVSNAIKFTDVGSVHISLSYEVLGSGKQFLEFSVRDTGQGISKADTQRLFQPFTQLDNSRKRERDGTGLGLFLVQKMADLMGGTTGVWSEVGKGSCFWFKVEVDTFKPSMERIKPRNNHVVDKFVHKQRILVVEDNPVNLKVISKFLQKAEYEFTAAQNGEEALKVYEEGAFIPEVILMDCHMPKMDGFEATLRIRELESDDDIPQAIIIALTADAYLENREHCYEVGMDDFLEKPVKYHDLIRTLRKWSAKDSPVSEV
jgi:PAS domain S-box-containing protein